MQKRIAQLSYAYFSNAGVCALNDRNFQTSPSVKCELHLIHGSLWTYSFKSCSFYFVSVLSLDHLQSLNNRFNDNWFILFLKFILAD